MARIPMMAGNWKMHGTRAETAALAGALVKSVGTVSGREVVIAPPFTALETARQTIAGSVIKLSAQNVHGEPKGAYTGEICAAMLVEAGCTHVIIGHSERRQYFGETDASVNHRLKAALAAGLVPIVCVGETLAEREGGTTEAVVDRQTKGGFAGIDAAQLRGCVVAYEPVWAIGTGKTASPEQAQDVHRFIRGVLTGLGGNQVAGAIRILYGGSVKPDNVDALMAKEDIDGALVGGASLDAASFTRIVQFEES
ncbi:MAG TPA: triose-phosphate isomerase [Candidatus Binatia bacterium]|jgi:triosephosphate isomerase|nr:triose-phosphate isomerase [Candidatus Binatia bacterium]